jgi:hypothetical protein
MTEIIFDPRENTGNSEQAGTQSYWKDLGVYEFAQGQTASITVNGDNSTTPLFADAVILFPEK